MKFISMLILLSALISCSSRSPKEGGGNESDEEGQISSNEGTPLIYYRDGDVIVIRSCDNSSEVNLKDPKIARAKCKGKENRVTVELFRQVLNKIIAEKAAEKARKEAKAATSKGGGAPAPAAGGAPGAAPKSAQEKLEDAQIEKQLQFIETYNQDKLALDDLRSTQVKGIFNQKLKDQLSKTVNNVVNNGQSITNDPDDILYSVLKSLDPNKKKPCGLKGPVSERIKNCASTPGATLNGWNLVLRTKSDREIWKEQSTGLVWGGMLGDIHDHIDAVGQCTQMREENGELEASEFRLPSIDEFTKSAFNSDANPLKSKEHRYWTSTSEGPEVWVYDGSSGKKKLTSRTVVTKDKQNNEFSSLLKLNVRCVGKIQ